MDGAPTRSDGWVHRLVPYWPLVVLAVVGFGLRVAMIELVREPCPVLEEEPSGTCYFFDGDSRYVATQAVMLREGRGFGDAGPEMYGLPSDEPGASHPPLFTLYVAGLQAVGFEEVSSWRLSVALAGSVGVGLVGLAAWRVVAGRERSTGPLSRRAGVLAAGFAASSPLLMARDVDFQVEGLLIPLTALFVVTVQRLWRHPGYANAALVGFVVGILWLTRGEQILLLVFSAPVYLWGLADREPIGRRIGLLATSGAIAFVLMAPWMAYNLGRFERPTLISTNLQITVLLASCDAVYYGKDFGYYNWDCVHEIPLPDAADDSVREVERGAVARAYLREHWTRTPVVAAAKLGRFYNVYLVGDTEERTALQEGSGWVLARTGTVATWVLGALSVVGAVWIRRQRLLLSPLLAPVITATLVVAVLIPLPRFRVGTDTVACILAAVGVWAVLDWWRDRSTSATSVTID